MRFEIRTGGTLLILLGLLGLSGAVFVLGLIAGYEMARTDQSSQPVIAQYSLSGAPAAPAPTSQSSPAAPPAFAGAPPAAARVAALATPSAMATPRVAKAVVPAAAKTPNAAAVASDESAGEENADTETTAPAPATVPKAGSYSVQIEAVMDKQGADDMVRRLRSLGYLPYIIEADINGQTWYRVRIGPYATPAEARAAQEKLHQKYNGAFTTH